MKYIIFAFTMIITISWQVLQANSMERSQYSQFQIHGKVHGLKGNMVLNIQDNYLTLSAFDRFTLLVQAINSDKLTMIVVDKPRDQQCEIVKSKQNDNMLRLNIYCQTVSNLSFTRGANSTTIMN